MFSGTSKETTTINRYGASEEDNYLRINWNRFKTRRSDFSCYRDLLKASIKRLTGDVTIAIKITGEIGSKTR